MIEAYIEFGVNGGNYYLIDNNALYTVGFGSTCQFKNEYGYFDACTSNPYYLGTGYEPA